MELIETPTFTRMIQGLLGDKEYGTLQFLLAEDPERGDVIRGGGGIRKLRYAIAGRGKSGGVRVIYYWRKASDQIYLLVVYPVPQRYVERPREALKRLRQFARAKQERRGALLCALPISRAVREQTGLTQAEFAFLL